MASYRPNNKLHDIFSDFTTYFISLLLNERYSLNLFFQPISCHWPQDLVEPTRARKSRNNERGRRKHYFNDYLTSLLFNFIPRIKILKSTQKKNTYPMKARGKSVLAAKRQWYELLNSEIFWRYYWKSLFETCVIYPPYQAMKSSLRKVTVMIKLKFNWGKVVIKGIFHSPSFNKCLSNIFPCPLLFYRVPQP